MPDGIVQSADRNGLELKTSYSDTLYCPATSAQVVSDVVVTLRPSMAQSRVGSVLPGSPKPGAPGWRVTWSPGAEETLYEEKPLKHLLRNLQNAGQQSHLRAARCYRL